MTGSHSNVGDMGGRRLRAPNRIRCWPPAIAGIALLMAVTGSGVASAQAPMAITSIGDSQAAWAIAWERMVRGVFDDLVRSIDAPQAAPRLVFVRDSAIAGARYVRFTEEIQVEERLYDVCRSLGADSLNALAYVLGHELAHYYGDRKDNRRPARRSRAKDFRHVALRVPSMQYVEFNADLYAAFYGRVAGYDVARAAPLLLHVLYTRYGLDEQPMRYQPLMDRKALAWKVDERLRRLYPRFAAATMLLRMRLYDDAACMYRDVIERFPSRELYNNTGVAYAQQALALMGQSATRFLYPFELDADTRLGGLEVFGGAVQRGSRSPTRQDSVRALRLLDSAGLCFDAAYRIDPRYTPAVINQASVQALAGRGDNAIGLANLAQKLDTGCRTRQLAAAVVAIARADSAERAAEQLQAVLTGRDAECGGAGLLAQANLAVFRGTAMHWPAPDAVPSGTLVIEETISGFRGRDTAAITNGGGFDSLPGAECLAVRYWASDEFDVLRIDRPGLPGRSARRMPRNVGGMPLAAGAAARSPAFAWINIIRTRPGYTGESAYGIRIGSTAADVFRLYGTSPRMIRQRNGMVYAYDYAKLMFVVDDAGIVRQWIVYAVG